MCKSVAAMPELLLVGRNATIMNAQPYKVNEYNKLKQKNKNMFTFLNTPIAQTTVVMIAVPTQMAKNKINHARK